MNAENIDGLLMVVKYTGSILAGAYGVYATITDFHEEKNGVKRISHGMRHEKQGQNRQISPRR